LSNRSCLAEFGETVPPTIDHLHPMNDELALVLRGAAVGLALSLALAALSLPSRPRRALLPVLLCLVGYLVRSSPQVRTWPFAALLPMSIGALLFPLAFWWLVHNAFDDRVDVPWLVWIATALLLVAGLSRVPIGPAPSLAGDGPRVAQKVIAAGFVVAGLWRLWRSGAGDLVAGRRRLRGWLLVYIGGHGLAVLTVELWLRGQPPPTGLDTVNVAIIGLALAVSLSLLLGFRATAVETLFGATPAEPSVATPAPGAMSGAAADAPLIERVQRLMAVDHAYRDPGLSLSALAQRLRLPEYRLRELINVHLGFRNFPAFVNEHRLREVEARLRDPAFDGRPILTLALEAGFGSIGPFNRAFRDRYGMTPSVCRGQRGSTPLTSAS
jgi:AraC-like DNA-binding protein